MKREDGKRITLAHGGGGVMMERLIHDVILPRLGNPTLDRLEDAAVLAPEEGRLAFTTDSFVVKPLFFRGGDVGRLAVCGTVNDLAVMGARPLALSLGMIIEEGLPIADLERILDSIAGTAREAEVEVVTGDTKVVERGAADGIFITTAGVGTIPEGVNLSPRNVREGDAVIVSGTVGDHGIAITSEREGLNFETSVESDVAPLAGLVGVVLGFAAEAVHCMRDPTRGGTAAVLNEVAAAAGVEVVIDEERIPIREEVAAACEMLGFDPLHVPNEGRVVLFCSADVAEPLLERMRSHESGRDAAIIGSVRKGERGRVILHTKIGGTRIVVKPYGEQLPRIC